jgi:hypothetical protein
VINFKYLGCATCLAKNIFFDNCPKRFRGNECDRSRFVIIFLLFSINIYILVVVLNEKERKNQIEICTSKKVLQPSNSDEIDRLDYTCAYEGKKYTENQSNNREL